MILVCAATGVEARACLRGIARADSNETIEVLRTGVGPDAARRALRRRVLDPERPRPSVIVSSGFAGARGAELEVGDWVMGTVFTSDAGPPLKMRVAPELPDMLRITRVRVVAVREIEVGASLDCARDERGGARDERGSARDLLAGGARDEPGAAVTVVDMESYALAEVAEGADVPFLCLRVISDTPAAPIPRALQALIPATSHGRLQRARQLGTGILQALTSPGDLAAFVLRSRSLPDHLAEGWTLIARGWRTGSAAPAETPSAAAPTSP